MSPSEMTISNTFGFWMEACKNIITTHSILMIDCLPLACLRWAAEGNCKIQIAKATGRRYGVASFIVIVTLTLVEILAKAQAKRVSSPFVRK